MYFYKNLEKYSDSVAIIRNDLSVVTYNDLQKYAFNIIKNILPGKLVFNLVGDNVESISGYIGFLQIKAPQLLLDKDIYVDLLANLMETYRPYYIFMPQSRLKEDALVNDLTVIESTDSYVLCRTNHEQDYSVYHDLALLLSTSGSTGSPKLVRLTYDNLQNNTESISNYLSITSEDRAITTMPMSYSYGLSIINTHLHKGATIILSNSSLMEKKFWNLLQESKATTFGGVPYIYEMLKRLKFSQLELPSLKYLTQAGGKLREDLLQDFVNICDEKGIEFITMYGQTEATARMSYLPWKYAREKVGSIGIAIPGGKLSIKEEGITNNTKIGELIYEGENVSLGYATSRFDLENGDENRSLLFTGDIARQDSDGFFYIVGRTKRFIKLFGFRINLDDVEHIIHNEHIECACIGNDDKLLVLVTQEEDVKKVQETLINKVKINKIGFTIKTIDSIPRSEAGKTLYSKLMELIK